ncbi:MAG: NAD(P)/FAD-dependent oxidoreductase [Candidatus Hadarchaeum sp.]|uniref:NAD(P)/FAD-dependent oxidoreductase n=2 Tax=Candidatus Hadarchaeum sp. TaxID=2883567 RepID=UPI00317706E0
MPERWDVIVVGGGTAGLSAAKSASSEGGKVLLLEMSARIGTTAQLGSLVSSDFKSLGKKPVVQRLRKIELYAPHGELSVNYDRAVVVDQRRLDEHLAADVAEHGGEIWLNAPVRDLLVKDGVVVGVRIEAGGWSENIEGEVIIDATGARGEMSSLFLRHVVKRYWNQDFLAFSNEYLMANVKDGKNVEIFFDAYSAPGGHAWIYPLSSGFAAAGVIGLRIHPDAALDEFLGRRKIKKLAHALPIASSRGQLPLEGPLCQTHSDGILAVGGAAGQIYPLSGQGLLYSLKCGEIAGRVAVDAVTEGDVSKNRLLEYDRTWRADFGKDFEVGSIFRSSLSVSQDRKMDAIISLLDGKPSLQRAFVDVLFGFNLRASMPKLLGDEDILKILGREITAKLIGWR